MRLRGATLNPTSKEEDVRIIYNSKYKEEALEDYPIRSVLSLIEHISDPYNIYHDLVLLGH